MRAVRAALALALCGVCTQFAAHAQQTYPAKAIRMIVPFAPGGGSDVTARILSAKLSERLKQHVIVDNRTGAGGAIGTEIAAKAVPDGYTVLLGSMSELALYPAVAQKVGYDTVRDFAPVALAGDIPFLLVTNPSLPVRNTRELIALAKARPGEINYGSAGAGSTSHMTMALFGALTGTRLVHIPYKGSAPATADLVAGHLQAMMGTLPAALPFAKSGRLRALAVSSAKRWPSVPEYPTVAESGVPGYEVILWTGVLVPAAVPREIVTQLNREIANILTLAEVKESFGKQGAEINSAGPEQFAAIIRSDLAKWAKVAREMNIRID
ncbi:MAG TPA: tripartite tricarboxylate transporter substrate binding protein [Burkholderiales bacterium]|nr:tripartite tricarboxylate transporter substrate binding protein [Burkholderiales bacterium]